MIWAPPSDETVIQTRNDIELFKRHWLWPFYDPEAGQKRLPVINNSEELIKQFGMPPGSSAMGILLDDDIAEGQWRVWGTLINMRIVDSTAWFDFDGPEDMYDHGWRANV